MQNSVKLHKLRGSISRWKKEREYGNMKQQLTRQKVAISKREKYKQTLTLNFFLVLTRLFTGLRSQTPLLEDPDITNKLGLLNFPLLELHDWCSTDVFTFLRQ